MKIVFQNRRARFIERCLKYLRYVLNDHFVLVIMFLSGFLMFQYRELLANFPTETWPIYLVLFVVLAVGMGMGRIGTFIESPDKQFLLAKEVDIISVIKTAQNKAFMLWGLLQLFLTALFIPIFLALRWSLVLIIALMVCQLALKWLFFSYQASRFLKSGRLDWDLAIFEEKKRQQSILKFFALFTNVKGVSTSTKRRAYLDVIVKRIPKTHDKLWLNLYLQAFLRSGDYLALSLRLAGLSLLSMLFIKQAIVAIGLALLFNYLLLFQLLALYHHYDYQYLTQLYPIDKEFKKRNLLLFLKWISVILMVIEGVMIRSWSALGLLLAVMAIIHFVYLPYKLKKMID